MTEDVKKFGSLDDILAVEDISDVEVYMPMWGMWVLLRPMKGDEYERWEASTRKMNGKGVEVRNSENLRTKMIAKCLIERESGQRMLRSKEQIAKFSQKSTAAIQLLWDECCKINGLSKSDQEKIEENLDETDGDDSATD